MHQALAPLLRNFVTSSRWDRLNPNEERIIHHAVKAEKLNVAVQLDAEPEKNNHQTLAIFFYEAF